MLERFRLEKQLEVRKIITENRSVKHFFIDVSKVFETLLCLNSRFLNWPVLNIKPAINLCTILNVIRNGNSQKWKGSISNFGTRFTLITWFIHSLSSSFVLLSGFLVTSIETEANGVFWCMFFFLADANESRISNLEIMIRMDRKICNFRDLIHWNGSIFVSNSKQLGKSALIVQHR